MFFLGSLFLSSCATVSFHDSAVYDQERAAELIRQLKNDTLLIAYPTYQKKERIVKSALKKFPESEKKLMKDLEDIKNDRVENLTSVQNAFNENFTFCTYLFIPDSLVYAFEAGEERPFFLGENGSLDPTIIHTKKKPFKVLHRTDTEWDLRIGNELLPNPFPNRIAYRNNLLELLGLEDFGTIVKKISLALQRRLDKFYNNPTRAVRY
ncbi:MAG: hypothetical protein ACJATI_000760 [Halioglobus sp.]|jgi:hypothetical protein